MLTEEIKEGLKEFFDKVEMIILFGSAVRKEKPRDVDILVVVSDSTPDLERLMIISDIKDKLKKLEGKLGVTFHVQPYPFSISEIWLHLLKAEPWIVTAISQGVAIHDSKGILPVLKKFAQEVKYIFEERAEMLIERARDTILEIEGKKMEILEKIGDAVLEGMQIFLLMNKRIVVDRKKIVEIIEKDYKDELEDIFDDFMEIMILYEKARERKLLDISMGEIEWLEKKALKILEWVQKYVYKKFRGEEGDTKGDTSKSTSRSEVLQEG